MHGKSFATHAKEAGKIRVTAGEDKQFVEIPPDIGKKAMHHKKVTCRVRWESKQTWEAPKKVTERKVNGSTLQLIILLVTPMMANS